MTCAHCHQQATYYYPGLGACGETDGNSDPVVAISHLIYGNGGNCFQVMRCLTHYLTDERLTYGSTVDANHRPSHWHQPVRQDRRRMRGLWRVRHRSATINYIEEYWVCADDLSADLSPSLFESLGAPLSQGVIEGVEWHFEAKGFSP